VDDDRCGALNDLAKEKRLQLALVRQPADEFRLEDGPAEFMGCDCKRPIQAEERAVEAEHSCIVGDASAAVATKQLEDSQMEVRIADNVDHTVKAGHQMRQRAQRANAGCTRKGSCSFGFGKRVKLDEPAQFRACCRRIVRNSGSIWRHRRDQRYAWSPMPTNCGRGSRAGADYTAAI
jgi:hypothetical protein